MARKSCYELMDKYYADAVRRHQEDREFRDPGSSFVNIEQIRKTKRVSHGNKLFFRVREDGSLERRT
jgi:hypothetical protein